MASLQKSIRMYDELYDILNVIVSSAVVAASTLEDMWDTVNEELDTSPIENVRDELEKMTVEWNEFEQAISELDVPKIVVPQIDILAMNQVINVEVGLISSSLPITKPQEIRPHTVPNAPPISAKMRTEWKPRESRSNNQNGNALKPNLPKVSVTSEIDLMKGIEWLVDYATYGAQANYDQARAEAQLMAAMSNNPDIGYDLQYTGESPVAADTQALQNAVDSIVDTAYEIQGRGIYTDDAMIAGATELSSAFSDPTAIVMMMDSLADFAMGVSGGGEVDSATMAQYAGVLGEAREGSYEAMIEKGLTFTEAQKAVIEGTATQEQVIAAIGAEYLNTSQDIQAAAAINAVIADSWNGLYESLSNTPEGKIIQMNSAFGEIGKTIGTQLYPFVLLFVDLIINNQGTIQAVLSGIALGLEVIMGVLAWLLQGAVNFAQAVIDNWSLISPIIYGIIAALAVYLAIAAIIAVINGIHAASEATKAAAQAMATGATFAETVAQNGLNAALAACPLTWIILLIIALIAVIFAVCNAIAKTTGVASSGFGVITGCINVAIQFFKNLGLAVANIALGIWNAIGALTDNMKIAFNNAICSVQSWWYGLLATALFVVEGICEALNKLPFVEFDYSGISSAADEYATKALEVAGNREEYKSVSDAFNEGFNTFDDFQDGWVSEAFEAGAAWGDGIADKVGDFSLTDLFGTEPFSPDDYGSELGDGGIGEGVDNIVENTGSIKDSLVCTEEDLRYLRDIAEQEAVNRYTLAEVKIEQTNHNNINSAMDLDGVVSGLTDAVNESIDSITEGVHE